MVGLILLCLLSLVGFISSDVRRTALCLVGGLSLEKMGLLVGGAETLIDTRASARYDTAREGRR